jgi:hypothetical protein
MRSDQVGVDAVTHDILENAVLLCGSEAVEASSVKIGDTGDEGEAKHMAKRKDEIADTTAIDMVPDNVEAGVGLPRSCPLRAHDGITGQTGDSVAAVGPQSPSDAIILCGRSAADWRR